MVRELKDSGVEWIGETPENWNITKFKYVMKKEKVLCENYTKENILSLTKSGVIVRDLENPTGKMPATFDGYQYVKEGDLLLCLFDIDVTPRCVGIVKDNGITSPAYSRYHLKEGNSLRYYNYLLTYLDDNKILLSFTKSLRNTLTDEYFGVVKTLSPALVEQQKIADFLDEKTNHIDSIIEKTKQSIEEFKKYKQALITETVTKGINRGIKMKNSGIEWMGEIPEHWEISKLKYLLEFEPPKTELFEKNINCTFLPMEKLRNGKMNVDTEVLIEDVYSGYSYFKENDIVLAKVTPCFENGNIAIAENLVNSIGFGTTEIFTIRPRKINTKYLFYRFQEQTFKEKGKSTMYGVGGLKRLPGSFITNYKIGIPSPDEQQQIAEYLDEKTTHIDSLIDNKISMISQLEEYKKSMIYEYVTGKKEVK